SRLGVSTMPATLTVTVARRPSSVRRLLRRPAAALALAVVGVFVLIALGAPWLAPFDPIATDFGAVRKAPSALHRLGTDEVGRDVLARLIWGARASLLAGRNTVLAVKAEEYVEAARALGGSPLRIGLRAILPNMLPPLLIQSSLTVAAAIIAESSLSFLGLGQQPPAPSWGSMLNAAQRYLSQAPWMALYPGLAIFAIDLALNVLGDGLRDVLDPRHR